jgi:endo-1,4-beta-mannosidase
MSSGTASGPGWPEKPWVGVNFWSRQGGPRMWARYDRDVVRQELAVLAEHGCTLTRSFCYWPDFVPRPEVLDEEVMARFVDFLDLHQQAGLGTIPTFIVGHMSGANWDPVWRGDRDLYRDVWLVAQQAWYVAEVARRTAGHPAVVAWLLTNEMPIYGRDGDQASVTSWARLLVQALRSTGARQPVSVGDGAWGTETSGNDNGFSLRRLAPLVDFIGPHTYPMSDDPVRQMMAAAFHCELCGSFGKPVILEEFGLSSDFVSADNAAHYYRQVLHSSLLAGARGWLAWNNCDYDNLAEQEPYSHHAFEMHFGVTDSAGRPKPQLDELARFSALVHELTAAGWERVAGEVALWAPELFEHDEPSWSYIHRADIHPNMYQSYIAAREADLPVAVVRERDMVVDGAPPAPAKLHLLPCAKLVTAPGMKLAMRLAEDGATVFASYFAGSQPGQRGPWMPWLERAFGVRHHLRYGLADPIEDAEVTFEMVADLGELVTGTTLSFPVGGNANARAYLPAEPDGAQVLAVDGHGRPALLRHQTGKGAMVLCTYPIEHMASERPRSNPEATWRLYSALATSAGVSRPLRAADPRVSLGRLKVGERDAFVALNLSPDDVSVDLLSDGRSILSAEGATVARLALAPYEVAVLYLDGAAH